MLAGARTGAGTYGRIWIGTAGVNGIQIGPGDGSFYADPGAIAIQPLNATNSYIGLFGASAGGGLPGGIIDIHGGWGTAGLAAGEVQIAGGFANGGTAAGNLVLDGGPSDTSAGGDVVITGGGASLLGQDGGDITLNSGPSAGGGGHPGVILFNARAQGQQGTDVGSANDMTLSQGNYFDVTGAVQINGIAVAAWRAGSVVSLQFDSTPTVKHNTAAGAGFASFQLAGAVDFVASAGDTLTIIYDGTFWRELARAVI